MNKINLTYVIVAVIIGIAILGYGYLNYSQKQKQLDFEAQKQGVEAKEKEVARIRESARIRAYEDCLQLAYLDYKQNWDIRVKNSGSTDGTLFKYQYEDLEQTRDKDEELCVKKYK